MKDSLRIVCTLIGGLLYLTAATVLTPRISESVCQWTSLVYPGAFDRWAWLGVDSSFRDGRVGVCYVPEGPFRLGCNEQNVRFLVSDEFMIPFSSTADCLYPASVTLSPPNYAL